jgi:hypothetical protein
MDYEQFDGEFRRVLDCAARLSSAELSAEIERLRGLAAQIADPRDRRDAENDIASLASVLSVRELPPSTPAEIEAGRVHSRAIAGGGTPEDRIARAEAGMAEISRIAGAVDPSEKAGILELNESLYLVVTALRAAAGPERQSPSHER